MRKAVVLSGALLVALLGSLPVQARQAGPGRPAAGNFEISLPAGSMVRSDSPSHLVFTVKNTGASGELSGLSLRFPPGYEVSGVSPPTGWTVEASARDTVRETGEISFRTSDDVKCTPAIAPGRSLAFGITVIPRASRAVAPGKLLSARAKPNCGGESLDSRAELPSWDRLEIEMTLTASPSNLRLGEAAIVMMTVSNFSTVKLKDLSAFLRPTGTGGVDSMEGPTPEEIRLAPGATGTLTWTARATSPGSVGFSGQVVARDLISPSVESNFLFVNYPDLPPDLPDKQGASGQDAGTGASGQSSVPVLADSGTSAPSANPTSTPGAQANAQPPNVGGTTSPSYVPPVTQQQGAIRVHLVTLLHDGTLLPGGWDFSASTLRDLLIVVEYQNLAPGPHTQRLKLFAPDGALYQQFTSQFQVASAQPAQEPGWDQVETRLHVGGTWITEHSLYGTWRFEVYLNQASQPTTSGRLVLRK